MVQSAPIHPATPHGERAARRPLAVALAMEADVARRQFTAQRLARLSAAARLVSDTPVTDFDDAELGDTLASVELLITGWGCPPITDRALDRMPRLRTIVHAAGTVKGHVTDTVWQRGIEVSSATAANAIPVAEFTVAMIILAGKRAFPLARELNHSRSPITADELYPGMGNYAKRVGLVGASTIGRDVIRLLHPYDLEIVVADPYLSHEDAARLGVVKLELDELLATSDVISLHAPELPQTRHMLDEAALALIRGGATLINTARGSLIDQDALSRRLARGDIFAILDVTDPWTLETTDPLYDMPNVFMTPHIAGSLGTELGRLADTAIGEVNRVAAGLALAYPVDRNTLFRSA